MSKGKSNFRKELKTAFFTYALAPVIIASLLVYCALFFSWYLSITGQNRGINRTLYGNLELIIDTCRKALHSIGEDHRLWSALEGEIIDTSLYEDLYAFSRQTEISCLFHVLTPDLRMIMSNTTQIPWYAGQPNNLNLGILKTACAETGQVVTEINKQPLDDDSLPPVTMALAVEVNGYLAGFLCVDLLYSDVLALMSKNSAVSTVLTDQCANIAAANLPQFSNKWGKLKESLQRNDQLFRHTNDHRFVSMSTLERYGLSILTITDTTVFEIVIVYTALFLVVLFIVIAGILSVSAGNIAARKTAVVDQIVDGLQKVREGNLDRLMSIESPEEFRIIGESFNKMLTDIKQLIAENAEKIRQKAQAEIRQLESHFNPHFLFNTLETIRYMLSSDTKSAHRMILNLSSLLRYSISCEKTEVTLSEDSRYITNYLMIQKCRFTNRFLYEVHIDEQAMGCYIPRLVMQPLIENSLKHGFAGKVSLSLYIRGRINNGNLVIEISDNGCGIQQEELHTLKLLLECEVNESRHHGLYNVHRRIKLMYGVAYGLQIDNCEDGGTYIRLTLPAVYIHN